MKKMTLIATGDAFITRRFPEGGYEGFEQVRDVISQYDVKFSNLEMTFHNEEGYPAAFSGGTWAMADPRTLDDMRSFGFNLFNTANNHSCDYSHGGVLATIRNLEERDMIFAGTGKNLSEASKPCYLETKNGRVAMIAVSSSFHESGMAGGQSAELIGRPGLNPLRYETIYHVTEENYKKAEELAALTKINATMERSVKMDIRIRRLPEHCPLEHTNLFWMKKTGSRAFHSRLIWNVSRRRSLRQKNRQISFL